MIDIALLAKICELPGAPGYESKIRNFIIEQVTPLCNSVYTDNLGNVIPENNRCITCHPSPYYTNLKQVDVKNILGLQLPSDPRWVNLAEISIESSEQTQTIADPTL